MKQSIILIAALLMTARLWAADYYCSSTGSDSNPGTIGSPFLTAQKGVNTAQPGDTVWLMGSVDFNEYVLTARSGTEANPITIRAGGTARLARFSFQHAWIVLKETTLYNEVGFLLTAEDCIIEDCIINVAPSDIKPTMYMQHGDWGNRPRRCIIRNNQLLNAGAKKAGIALSGRDHLIENNYFSSPNGADAIILSASYCTIRGNTVQDWSNFHPTVTGLHTDIIQAWGHNGEISVHNIIENNWFTDCVNCQIGNWQDNLDNGNVGDWTFRNNVWDRVDAIVSAYIPRVSLYNNVIYKSGLNSGGPFLLRGTRGTATGWRIFNNIFMECGKYPDRTTGGSWSVNTVEMPGGANLVSGNNLNIGRIGTAGFNKTDNLAGNHTGLDPQFVAPVNAANVFGFRLQPTSPVIGLGTPLNEYFTTDFEGTVRGAEWDLGAFEYEEGSEPVDSTAPTLTSAAINGTGLYMSLIFDEPVQNVSAAHYSLPGYTLTLETVNGAIVTFSLSPIVQIGANKLLNYTSGAGRTSDIAGNLLATFSNFSVVNGSVEAAPDPPRAGRRGRGANVVPAGR